MTETLQNPVLRDGMDESAFLEAAQKADRGEDFRLPSADNSETRATDTTAAEDTSANPDTTLETDRPAEQKPDRPRDAQGRFTTREDGTDIPESERKPADQTDTPDAQAEAKGRESEYQKKAKEREALGEPSQIEKAKRLEREAKQYREDAIRYQRELEAYRQQQAQPQHQRNGHPQFTSQDFADYADECARKADEARKAGDYDEADKLASEAVKATRVSLQAVERERNATQQDWQQQMHQHISYDVDQVRQRYSELADPKSPLTGKMNEVFAQFGPIADQIPLTQLPNGQYGAGITLLAELAKARLEASAASGLEEENKKLKARLEEAEKRTALGRGGASSQIASPSPESMSDAEFLRAAEAADAGRY